jgi:tRNA nucleotidyltransferase/poly(A) polymerase
VKSAEAEKSKPLYDRAVQIVNKLRSAGYQAYFAGGSVRDQIRGVPPTDYDIATSAKPEDVLSLFPQAIPVGVAFGVVLIPVGRLFPGGEKTHIEIATFRSDGVYRDGRHPESVIFSNEKEDALRRDFTINGMFFDPSEKRIIDYVGGREDLKAGLIRTIGDPELRFKEDYLRIIRAVRFAAQFSFRIEPGTYAVIQKMADSVRGVSQERIRDELEKILTGANPAGGLILLEESGILKIILPEIILGEGAARFSPILKCFGFMIRPSFELAMSTLLYQIEDSAVVHGICSRLKLSNAQTDRIISIVRDFPLFQGILKMGEAELKRFLRVDYLKELLELYHAAKLAFGESLTGWEFCVQKLETFRPEDLFPPALLSGDDLIKMGYSPGPLFKKILYDLEGLQLEGKIKTVEEAKARILKEYPEKNENKRKIKI